jgi:glycosyltransferase involved in cell wall biosynthesis
VTRLSSDRIVSTAGQDGSIDVAYVVPRLTAGDDSHFAHLPALLEAVGRLCRLAVVAERADHPPVEIRGVPVVVQQHADRFRLVRMLELVRIARHLRKHGCRRFFVRISVTAALTLAVAGPLLGITVYYWTSGDPVRILPPWSRRPVARLFGEARLLPFRLTLRLVDRVVTGPERMLAFYQRTFGVRPARCVLLYNDIDVDRFATTPPETGAVRRRFGLPETGTQLLFVHRISRRKGCFEVAPLMERLPSDVHCLMVGDGPHAAEVRADLAARGLEPRVRLAGAVPNPDLPPICHAADIAIVPSHEEGFPRVVLEAMAAGLPVVAYDVGGLRDLLGSGQQSFVVAPGDVDAFAAAVGRLAADPTLRARLGNENVERVRRYDTSRVAGMFVENIVRP